MNNPNSEFKRGMGVALKSGGPYLTIASIDVNGNAYCIWFHNDKLLEGILPIATLVDKMEECLHQFYGPSELESYPEYDYPEPDTTDDYCYDIEEEFEYMGLYGEEAVMAWNNTH